MPILGRQGETLNQRLFGNPGVGQGLKNIKQGGLDYLVGRTAQAMETPGGFLGEKTPASTKYLYYTPPNSPKLSSAYQNLQIPTSGSGNKRTSSDETSSSSDGSDNLDKLRKRISGSFDDVISTYKSQIKELPGQQQKLLANVGQMASTQKSTIQDALSNALAKLQGNREEVQTQQKSTLQDLADNTRNLFQAGNVYLGTKGAGDSSATGMYSAALTQNANKERAGVQRDVNSMLGDINMKETDVNTDFQAQMNEVDTWMQQREQEIVMQFTDLKRQLEQAKAQASSMEKQNLANLEMELFRDAKTQLANIQNTASNYRNQLAQGIQSGSMLGQSGASSISETGQYEVGQVYSPQQIDISGLQDIGYGNEALYDKVTGNFWKVNEDGTITYLGQQ